MTPTDYDLRLEVLASIPPAGFARVKVLADDFGVTMDEVKEAAVSLATEYGVILLPSLDGNGKLMLPKDAQACLRIRGECQDYWQRVYGQEPPASRN
ncbi:MAG TPA: hypothetical protein VK797_05315 [Tepidisphaeraceae bacterium]|jgi:hypothetical protein|nr:hypothetical protein [Tepidisphaeraceae bacterium]